MAQPYGSKEKWEYYGNNFKHVQKVSMANKTIKYWSRECTKQKYACYTYLLLKKQPD